MKKSSSKTTKTKQKPRPRNESKSSSSRSPSPLRRPRGKLTSEQQKSRKRVYNDEECNKSMKNNYEELQVQKGTSLRHLRTSSAHGLGRGNEHVNIATIEQSSLSSFRIPKIKTTEKNGKEILSDPPRESDSKPSTSKEGSSSSNKTNRIKTNMKPRVLIDPDPVKAASSVSRNAGFLGENKKGREVCSSVGVGTINGVLSKNVSKKQFNPSSDVSFPFRGSGTVTDNPGAEIESFPVAQRQKGKRLKAKRQLDRSTNGDVEIVKNTSVVAKHPKQIFSEPSRDGHSIKDFKNHPVLDHSEPQTSKTIEKTFPDLPDYVGSESEIEEEMEWENPVPLILKMVKDASDLDLLRREQNQNDIIDIREKPLLVQLGINGELGEEMDVDPDPTTILRQSKIEEPKLEQVFVVPDTNIWISDLSLIQNLLDEEISRWSRVTIIIPWMVLQELDVGLHNSAQKKYNQSKQPVKFIYSLLSSKHPRVKGQKASEAAISKLKFDEIMADDSILNCAFQMQKNDNRVVFLSNDRNLLNKALVHGVLAGDSGLALKMIDDVLTKLTKDVPANDTPEKLTESDKSKIFTAASVKPTMKLGKKKTFDNFNSRRTNERSTEENNNLSASTSIFVIEPDDDDPMTGDYDLSATKIQALGPEIPSFVESGAESLKIVESLRLAFSYIIRWKMVDEFGMGGWEIALKIKPPWTLTTSIKCILTHWIAIFSYVFSRKGKPHLEKLAVLADKYSSPLQGDRSEIENDIVETALGLFNHCSSEALINDGPVLKARQLLLDYAVSNRVS